MAPTYVHPSTSSACCAGSVSVSVVSSVTPIGAVRPGSAPMITPARLAPSTRASGSDEANTESQCAKAISPSNISGQAHEEDRLEEKGDRRGGAGTGDQREHDPAPKDGDEAGNEHERRQPVGHARDQTERVDGEKRHREGEAAPR